MNFKVMLLGDGKVGKTTLRKQYMNANLDEEYLMTMGTEFSIKDITVKNHLVKLQIWDVAGQKLFTKVRNKYYKNTSGILLLFDLANKNSFRSIPIWIKEFLDSDQTKLVPIIIIGNKVDLVEDHRPLDQMVANKKIAELMEWVKSLDSSIKMAYIETSALHDINVRMAFEKLTQYMISQRSKLIP